MQRLVHATFRVGDTSLRVQKSRLQGEFSVREVQVPSRARRVRFGR